MRRSCAAAICLACGLLAGCQEDLNAERPDKNLDVELVKTLSHIGIENAIVSQHTLYPYHFVENGETLNDLGQHDLAVLARHYAERPGSLNVRRGEVSDELYQARVAQVAARLRAAGVSADRMEVSDGMPGGSGMPSEQVVTILRRTAEASSTRTRSAETISR